MSMCKTPGNLRRTVLGAAAPAVLALATAGSLQALAQGREQRPPAFTEEQVQRGRSIYQKDCQDCHGSTLDNGEFGGAPSRGRISASIGARAMSRRCLDMSIH